MTALAAGVGGLVTDPWVASSLLQKAIRRGDADLAERAAVSLYRRRGRGIWRRLCVIAFEDVGVGSVEAVVETIAIGTDPALRIDGDEPALRHVARILALASKDRSPDYLTSCTCHIVALARSSRTSSADKFRWVCQA